MPEPSNDSYAALLALMRGRRSIRRFRAMPLPEGTAERLIEAARWAPSASNRQAFRFIAVEKPEVRAQMGDRVREAVHGILASIPESERAAAAAYAGNFSHFESAPLVLVAYHRASSFLAERLGLVRERDLGALASVSAAIMNVLLAAHALGLGACWMTGPVLAASALEPYLGIPNGWQLSAVVPVGFPDETPDAPARRTVSQLLAHFGDPA